MSCQHATTNDETCDSCVSGLEEETTRLQVEVNVWAKSYAKEVETANAYRAAAEGMAAQLNDDLERLGLITDGPGMQRHKKRIQECLDAWEKVRG